MLTPSAIVSTRCLFQLICTLPRHHYPPTSTPVARLAYVRLPTRPFWPSESGPERHLRLPTHPLWPSDSDPEQHLQPCRCRILGHAHPRLTCDLQTLHLHRCHSQLRPRVRCNCRYDEFFFARSVYLLLTWTGFESCVPRKASEAALAFHFGDALAAYGDASRRRPSRPPLPW